MDLDGRRRERGGIVTKLGLLVVVAAVGAGALWWFVLRADAAPPPRIESTRVVRGGTLDGRWRVTPDGSGGSFVQYRVEEELAASIARSTATGRSTRVSATMKVEGTTISDVEVDADLTALASDQSRRDRTLRDRGLQTSQFPRARFVLTRPIHLPSAPALGVLVRVDAVGRLTLHGITRTVTVPLVGRWDGEHVQVVGTLPIRFAQYGITPPDIAGFVTVRGQGALELELHFVKSG